MLITKNKFVKLKIAVLENALIIAITARKIFCPVKLTMTNARRSNV